MRYHRNVHHTCEPHGPHFIIEDKDRAYCTICGPLTPVFNRCSESKDCVPCEQCKLCEKEEEKQMMLEAVTAPSLPKLTEELGLELKNRFTRKET